MQKHFAIAKKRARLIAVTLAAVGMVFGNLASISAAALTDVYVELEDGRPDQTNVTYTIGAQSFTASTARCVQIQFDTQSDGGGGVPSSMDTTGASLDTGTTTAVPTPGSWTEDYTTNGVLEINYATGETLTNGIFVFDGIDNGDTEGVTYFALVDTFTDASCSTGLDSAVVAWTMTEGEPVSLTIEPTLTFTTSGVASGQNIFPSGGPTVNTTVLSDASGIDHGTTVTSSTNGISAHDLNVTTNASNGYNVYIRHTQPLTNQTSDTITDHTGTNASPSAFPAAGTEAWGYSTDDSDLTQFYGLNLWAGFPTAGGSGGDQVMTNSGATSGAETVRVGHQVGVATDTPAGTYTTTIVYTVVATF